LYCLLLPADTKLDQINHNKLPHLSRTPIALKVEMKKLLCICTACLSLFFSTHATAGNKYAAIYRGLEPEISTLDDTIRILGVPISKRINNKFIFCKYRFIEVAVVKKTGKVGVIVIYDPSFKDVNGFMIGDPYEKIKAVLNDAGTGNAIYDKKKNVIYIFNQDNILEEIVYGVLSK
jgi:hypothetical protein